MDGPVERPMFPLGSVLFPAMPMPLRVFEPRYLQMLQEMFDQDPAEFGVVLIERGAEVGGGETRFGFGTMARIVEVNAATNVVSVVATGTERFEVVEWLADDPYPRALVKPRPALEWSQEWAAERAEVEAFVRHALARASECEPQRWPPTFALSDDPVSAIWQLAAIAPVGPLDQLSLLTCESVPELLASIAASTLDASELINPGF